LFNRWGKIKKKKQKKKTPKTNNTNTPPPAHTPKCKETKTPSQKNYHKQITQTENPKRHEHQKLPTKRTTLQTAQPQPPIRN